MAQGLHHLRRSSDRLQWVLNHHAKSTHTSRRELLDKQELAAHARLTAGQYRYCSMRWNDPLQRRLSYVERAIAICYDYIISAHQAGQRMPPGAEWLLDNVHIIDEHIRTTRRHLPRGYSRKLPRIASGELRHYPRCYLISRELIAHCDAQVDAESVATFVAAWQEECELTLGELWAIPIMIRVAVIENLYQVIVQITTMVLARQHAAEWTARLISTAAIRPSAIVTITAELTAYCNVQPNILSPSFVAEFTRQLRGAHPALQVATLWLDQRLMESQRSVAQLVQQENHAQAIDQQSMANGITSLRSLAAINWRGFVEASSRVEFQLRNDPAQIYTLMDFETRDRYRHIIEDLASACSVTESAVAQQAIHLAEQDKKRLGAQHRQSHVGYFLVDKGIQLLRKNISYQWPWYSIVTRFAKSHPLFSYLFAISTVVIAIIMAATWWLSAHEISLLAFGSILFFVTVTASQCAITVINWIISLCLKPNALPRLALSEGLPSEFRTIVVIPTLIRKLSDVDNLVDGLEVRFLANIDPHIDFALLTDFGDAKNQTLPDDNALIAHAVTLIEALNDKYSSIRPNIFKLFHRPRQWNKCEGVWMGRERKRGKIQDFNALLRNGERTHFSVIIGESTQFSSYRYVITLDTDTQLPRDAARELVGTLAHPLNRACIADDKKVTDGYVILQPRAAINLPSAGRSWFAQIFSGEPGIDPYSRAIADVYQDVFAEGSFIGKGIYDLNAFEHVLQDRFPDNAILSHDLIEGAMSRAGLVSDILVMEDHPMRYASDVTRRQRWMRGDWQLLPWLMPRVPTANGKRIKNPLSALSRWKLFDNLRRSLVAPSLLALLISSWLVLPNDGLVISLVVLLLLAPVGLGAIVGLLRKQADIPILMHVRLQSNALILQITQIALNFVFLVYEAVVSLEAILRTLYRLVISKRKLLEWTTASDAERNAASSFFGVYATMWCAPAIAIATATCINIEEPYHIYDAIWVLLIWAISPALAWFISRPINYSPHPLTVKQQQFIARSARKTWRYYQQFVTVDNHWLPPDNYQEYPNEVIAQRTSPTNMGLSLLANLSAFDFGYIASEQMVQRCRDALHTMETLPRYKGHFYNWYETNAKALIEPHYVSMVDSGNLAGHLIVLASSLRALNTDPIIHPTICSGLNTTLSLLVEQARVAHARSGGGSHGWMGRLEEFQGIWLELSRDLRKQPTNVHALLALLERCLQVATDFSKNVATASDQELQWWAQAFINECRDHSDFIKRHMPWPHVSPPPEWLLTLTNLDNPALTLLSRWSRSMASAQSLTEMSDLSHTIVPAIIAVLNQQAIPIDMPVKEWLQTVKQHIETTSNNARVLRAQVNYTAELALRLAAGMEWKFLFDPTRELFAIGFNVSSNRRDTSFYDLLASEARLGSFIAIAFGQISQDHWFKLGRLLTATRAAPALLSWSGSMFEYLMPQLVLPSFPGTILDQTCHAIIQRQISYARHRGIPIWGISESAFNQTDAQLQYQYRAFGVPGLGLKRGLSEDVVIAPYASAMALLYTPREACNNLYRTFVLGHEGRFGFFEAIDFTPSRNSDSKRGTAIRSFMVHHQGMSLLAFNYILNGPLMQQRMMANPQCKATELLLQERIPKSAPIVFPHANESLSYRPVSVATSQTMRIFTKPTHGYPEVHLISNGRYHVMVTASGSGYSRLDSHLLTRWHADPIRDAHGTYFYVRDLDRQVMWSTTWQPLGEKPESYQAIFLQGRAEFKRRDHDIETHSEIAVSPEDDVELRRVTIINRSTTARLIELTSYTECVIAPMAQDLSHPAFSNLFIESDIVSEHEGIICWRRPRAENEKSQYFFHGSSVIGKQVQPASYETNRRQFIGRSKSSQKPDIFKAVSPLTNTTGATLDPIMAIRQTVLIQPGESAQIDFTYGATDARDKAEDLLRHYHESRMTDRIISMGWNRSQVVLGQLGASEGEVQFFGRLASSLLYMNPLRRADANVLAANRQPISRLWSYGISGDNPIVLLQQQDGDRVDMVRLMINAHAYWRLKGVTVDLVISIDDISTYRQELYNRVTDLVTASIESALLAKAGGIFIIRNETLSESDRILLQTAAAIVLPSHVDALDHMVDPRSRVITSPRPLQITHTDIVPQNVAHTQRKESLTFANGIGGFSQDGRAYVITINEHTNTPKPWVNILANPDFGSIISETGSAYTWADNAHEYRLTPWLNDSVSDTCGEAFYIRDDERAISWSPMPWPLHTGTYRIEHGFGYSRFTTSQHAIFSELTQFVPLDAPLKIISIRVRNDSDRKRALSVIGYVEWVLGEHRQRSAPFIVSTHNPDCGGIIARTSTSLSNNESCAFFTTSTSSASFTSDRSEFIGFGRSLHNPTALMHASFSDTATVGNDPCAGLMAPLVLAAHEETQLIFLLGHADNATNIRSLTHRFHAREALKASMHANEKHWQQMFSTFVLTSSERSLDYLINGWLPYQIKACRLWARSGFYQSGGAFGFRDQLQDSMALTHFDAATARSHIIRAASRQFIEGDVQHWWHPPTGHGVRTRHSDDLLWLPMAVEHYVYTTGDWNILNESIPFITGRPLQDHEDNYYDNPTIATESGTLHEHCKRAIQHAMRTGPHRLPLIGSGDWNDGMNRVGIKGVGESVWLGFFFVYIATRYSSIAQQLCDNNFAAICNDTAQQFVQAVDHYAWDGQWYVRAWHDDGSVIGSSQSSECQIDLLPQTWSAITGLTNPERSRTAMNSVYDRLINHNDKIIALFSPPFSQSTPHPGYIQGYPPGIRENGGQYTHAALWAVLAYANLGDAARAWALVDYINPVLRTQNADQVNRYQVEPYVLAADIATNPNHIGHGGWTWYTGSAAWLYRIVIETLCGFKRQGDKVMIKPCIPATRLPMTLQYRYLETTYTICYRSGPTASLTCDAVMSAEFSFTLHNDAQHHDVVVTCITL